MRFLRRTAVVWVVCSGLVAAAWAQFGGMGRGMGQTPQIPGVFKPEVGAGAQYQVTQKSKKMSWAVAIVGKESVEGKDGYWLEMRMDDKESGGMIMKSLAVPRDGGTDIKRVIMQQPGQPPMEMPMGMMGMMARGQKAATTEEALGEKIGTETVTVPAGTFTCDHYRSKHGNEPADIWVAAKVSPYGLIKMTSASSTMVLEKVLSNETSKIKGEPQKMDFGMPGGRPQ
ncbi:MAG: hypothetical protein ACE145_15805 [Terriglobia bacterium]